MVSGAPCAQENLAISLDARLAVSQDLARFVFIDVR